MEIVVEAVRALEAMRPEIDRQCVQAHVHIEQRYRDALAELRLHFPSTPDAASA